MFPFQKGDLCFQISNNNNNNNNNDQVANNSIFNTQNNKRKHKHRSKTSSLAKQDDKTDKNDIKYNYNDKININRDEVDNKKMIHREIERQRRQEMATLYSSLRSILPLEYVKGKRTTSDHIDEATKYIKDLERNIKMLRDKRVQLKETICSSSNKSLHKNDGCNVSIKSFSKSIEIEISTGVVDENPFPLSSVLKVLDEEGLDVVSCVSTRVNDRIIYVTHCQVEEVPSVDSCQLQRRLYDVICS
ncbi:hypothetical protein RND81_12G119000 [Saponaria officinalis]|uniref:BHLH domain-containing protein n=1 Tax=Saponaria officinalis TaxID=3572 RepID=A0AAW1H9I7_SAPOF